MSLFVHIDKALKLAWVKRISNDIPSMWKFIPDKTLSKYGGLFLFAYDFAYDELVLMNVPEFYKQILTYIQEFNTQMEFKRTFLKTPIWNNKNIKVGNDIFIKLD